MTAIFGLAQAVAVPLDGILLGGPPPALIPRRIHHSKFFDIQDPRIRFSWSHVDVSLLGCKKDNVFRALRKG